MTGFSKLLPRLLETKVYVGSSAGSMVLGHRISTEIYQHVYGEGDDFGTTRYLELVNLAIKPHMNSQYFPNNNEDSLLKAAKGYTGIIYGLEDDAAIVVNGGSMTCIGSKPVIIND